MASDCPGRKGNVNLPDTYSTGLNVAGVSLADCGPAWLWAVLVAPFVGSVLGVLIRRLPVARPVILARSACESCGRALRPRELVPIVSYLVQRGRCRHCRTAIAPMHLTIELAAVAVAGIAAGFADGPLLWAGCVLGWGLLALAWIDVEWLLLPDALTLPLIVAGLAVTWALEPWAATDRAIGAIAGYAALRLVQLGYRRFRGVDGLGEGDAKLLAAAGAWLGWQALPWVLVLGALTALSVAGIMALRGRSVTRRTEIAFGAPIAAATWALWLAQHGDWTGLAGVLG